MAKLEFRKCTDCENPDPHGYFFFGEDVFLFPFCSVEFARLIVLDPLFDNDHATSSEISEMEAQMVNAGLPIKMREGELADMELMCDMTFGCDFEDMKLAVVYKVGEVNQPSCG